jgi:aminoglycoside phosphotransferase (APT) family kinase protein
MSRIDQPTAVRAGEELAAEPLAAYLYDQLGLAGPLEIAQFPGGYSNLTYLLRVGERELVLRRPPFGASVRGGHDMGREYRMLSALAATAVPVPRPLLSCTDTSVLGAPFYLMERVEGLVLRGSGGPADLTPDTMRRLCLALVDGLVALHALDYQAAGLGDLGRPQGYTERQVHGWTTRYANARTDDVPEIDQAAAWLAAHIPPQGPPALIHNDFKYDNVMLDPRDLARIVAVLDWEMATIGDPLTDLGTTLAYWMEPGDPEPLRRFGLTSLPGNLDRREWARRYAERSGRDIAQILFYFVYGLFKNAVIVQQIYARYRKGFTQDARFATLDRMVLAYGRMAASAIERNRIDHLY